MSVVKNYWPFMIGFILMAFIVTLLDAQEKPTEINFPVNFSCGQTKITDNQGKLNGWLVVTDITSRDDGLQMKTQHSQRMYRPDDDKKIDNYCLQAHKDFNADRDKERKRLLKQSQSRRKEIPISIGKEKISHLLRAKPAKSPAT